MKKILYLSFAVVLVFTIIGVNKNIILVNDKINETSVAIKENEAGSPFLETNYIKSLEDKTLKLSKKNTKIEATRNTITNYISQFTTKSTAQKYYKAIIKASNKYKIDPFMITAIIRTESEFNKAAISSASAVGAMQILPSTAKAVSRGMDIDYHSNSLYEIDANISIGTKYISDLEKSWEKKHNFGKDPMYLALISYNRGPSKTLSEFKNGNYVTWYADKVIKEYEYLKTTYYNHK